MSVLSILCAVWFLVALYLAAVKLVKMTYENSKYNREDMLARFVLLLVIAFVFFTLFVVTKYIDDNASAINYVRP